MRKEVLVAVVAGISIGLIVAFGSWKLIILAKKINSNTKINLPAQIKRPSKNDIQFQIESPLANSVLLEHNIIASGYAPVGSIVVASTLNKDYYTKANEEGQFRIEMEILEGLSIINFYNIHGNKIIEQTIDVTHIESENEKVEAIIGTITDISGDSLQIRTDKGLIQQVSINSDAKIYNELKNNQTIKQTDLAIGDFILAIGTVNTNKILAASELGITKKATQLDLKVFVGKYNWKMNNKLSITVDNDQNVEVILPKKWEGPDIKDLDENEEIIVIATENNNVSTLRSIFKVVE